MKNYFLIIILFLSVAACAQSKSATYSNASISKIVNDMAQSGMYESARIGFAGSPSPQYERMNELSKIANESDLKKLVRHESPAVRVYSYMAMLTNYPDAAEQVYERLSKDTSSIMTMEGCIGGSSTVADLVKRL